MTPPDVAELLDVDREFRVSGRPILHTHRDGVRYTALFSDSPMARRFGRCADWVIIDREIEGPNPHWTVVTEWRGILRGKRVVRGREVECFAHYRLLRAARPRRSHRPAAA